MITKKNRIITLAALAVVIGGLLTLYLTQPTPTPASQDPVSQNKSITLKNSLNMQHLANGTELAGTYHTVKDQALFYTITAKDSGLVSSGSILPDSKGAFSRNISFTKDDLSNDTKLDVKIYTQSAEGKITDTLAFSSVYQKK